MGHFIHWVSVVNLDHCLLIMAGADSLQWFVSELLCTHSQTNTLHQ